MNALRYLGVIVLLVGALILIYLGIAGTGQSNTGLVVGFVLVIVGYVLHIFLDKRAEANYHSSDKA